MSLTVIKGPPNSGRTELVRERFEARISDHPVLVVPSTDDIFGWERRLTRARGAFIGGKVVHFKDLIDEILGDESSVIKHGGWEGIASPLRRRALVTEAIREGWPAIAVHLRDQPGLVDAALRTIDEFRDNLIGVTSFDDPEVRAEVGPISDVFRIYIENLAESRLTDLPARAEAASTKPLEDWQGRPVFVVGFDDLTLRQTELIRRLSEQTEVTVAMTHEQGNRAMAITEGLLGRLLYNGAEVELETRRPSSPPDHDPLLVALERSFLDHSQDGSLSPTEAVKLIEASGRRGEAEAIGGEIARLIDRGVDPGDVAIAIDAPAVNGGVILDVLTEYEIPATLEAETKATETATGQAVLNLLRSGSPNGGAEELLALLRGPLGLDQDLVDRIEFKVIRHGLESGNEVKAVAAEIIGDIPGWKLLKEGNTGDAVRSVTALSAQALVTGSAQPLADSSVATETQMSTAIERAVEELEELHERLTAEQVIEALTSGAVKTWAVPTAHTVQIASPYSMRAKRARYLFVASLQERDLGSGEGSPLMSRNARSALGMPDLTDQEQQETYLFYTCLAVPTKGLWLSYRVADVHGKAEFPSPMIGEVTRLFAGGKAGLEVVRRSSSDILFPAGGAPSPHEWALSVSSSSPVDATTPALAAPLSLAAEGVSRARRVDDLTREFRNIDSDAARESIAARDMFSATALEAFIECPYKWFFERAMRPVQFGPDPEAIAKGNLIHEVLATLYRNHLGELPLEDEVEAWIEEMEGLVEQLAGSNGLGDESASHRIQRRQVSVEMSRFLRRESSRGASRFRPRELEQKFGFDEEGSMPPLQGDGWQLRGAIDRIDADPAGNGVVIDYKSGASSYKTMAEIKREGKIQLLLYLRALETHWGLTPAAGLYVPVFAAKKAARGLVAEDQFPALRDIGLVNRDQTPDLEAEIAEGLELAAVAAGRILRGEIAHDPSECLNHYGHAGVPDWNPGAGSDGSSG